MPPPLRAPESICPSSSTSPLLHRWQMRWSRGTLAGVAITRDRRARTIKLDQKTMAAQLVSKYGLDDAKPRGVPLSKSIELSRDTGEALDKDVDTYTNLV